MTVDKNAVLAIVNIATGVTDSSIDEAVARDMVAEHGLQLPEYFNRWNQLTEANVELTLAYEIEVRPFDNLNYHLEYEIAGPIARLIRTLADGYYRWQEDNESGWDVEDNPCAFGLRAVKNGGPLTRYHARCYVTFEAHKARNKVMNDAWFTELIPVSKL